MNFCPLTNGSVLIVLYQLQIVKSIYESSRKARARIRIEVPQREAFGKSLLRGKSKKFIYRDNLYSHFVGSEFTGSAGKIYHY